MKIFVCMIRPKLRPRLRCDSSAGLGGCYRPDAGSMMRKFPLQCIRLIR